MIEWKIQLSSWKMVMTQELFHFFGRQAYTEATAKKNDKNSRGCPMEKVGVMVREGEER